MANTQIKTKGFRSQIWAISVYSEDDSIVIAQPNTDGEQDDMVYITPCQVDLLIEQLKAAKNHIKERGE